MLVQAVKFPPIGDRGIDNAGLDADYNIHAADEYVAWANRETFLCVQIETPEAVRNVDAIAAVKGIDMIFVGPGDLGLRLRQSGEMSIDEAWERVAAACKRHGIAFGGPTLATEEMQKRKHQGAQLLVNCSEFQAFTAALARDIQRFDELA
jgi:2-keto-3-deoxy-L-rhamnonate aldolase RhmA